MNGQFCVDLNDVEHIPMSGIITSKSVPLEAHVSKLGLRERIKELHEQMGHVNPRIMAMAVNCNHPTWRDSGVTGKQILRYYGQECNKCLCFLASRNRPRKKERVSLRSEIPGEIISADPIFKIYPESYDHYKGAFLFANEATGFLHVFVGRVKSQFLDCLKIVKLWYQSWGHKMKYL